MSNDLKPCPFCGSAIAKFYPAEHSVFCGNCGCAGDTGSEAAAIAAWNRRPSLWRPIETAPRDGTEVLILIEGKRQAVAHWEDDSWWSTSRDTRILASCITHWQPLQPLPEPQE